MPAWYWMVFGALFGGSVASFLGVVVERVPRGESLGGRSRCVCGRPLTVVENVPVFGWIGVRGRSRCCKSRIPAWFVLSESAAAFAAGLAGALFGPFGVAVALLCAVVVALVATRRRMSARAGDASDGPVP